jgi:hypothetical protein
MDSEQNIDDWVNLPQTADTLYLWDTLHDGYLLSIESDLLLRTVTFQFEVNYVREFHQLAEDTQFVITVLDVQSVRSLRYAPWPGGCRALADLSYEESTRLKAEYHDKWREESWSWGEFEREAGDQPYVSNAVLARGAGSIALLLEFGSEGGRCSKAYVRGRTIKFFIGEKEVTPEEFVAAGEAYWSDWSDSSKRASSN